MDKFPRLNYRPKKARPFIVRYYDSASNKRTSRSFSARMDAMQFLAEMGGEGKERASSYEISTAEKGHAHTSKTRMLYPRHGVMRTGDEFYPVNTRKARLRPNPN